VKVKIEVGKILSSVVAITMAWIMAGEILIALTEISESKALTIILLGAIASWLWYFFTIIPSEE